MAKLENRNNKLYIDGKRVIKGWESFSGWYWFATEKMSDDIYYGYVQGLEEEWGQWSMSEMKPLIAQNRVWEIKKQDLPHAGRRN